MTDRKADITWNLLVTAVCILLLRHPIAEAVDFLGLYWRVFDSITTIVLLLFAKAFSVALVRKPLDQLKIDFFVVYLWDDLFDRLFFNVSTFEWNDVWIGLLLTTLFIIKHKNNLLLWLRKKITEHE